MGKPRKPAAPASPKRAPAKASAAPRKAAPAPAKKGGATAEKRPASRRRVDVVPVPPVTQPSGTALTPRPRADSVPKPRESSRREDIGPPLPPSAAARAGAAMQLTWDEPPTADAEHDARAAKWLERGAALLAALEEHGCEGFEYRADLKDARFVWVDAEGYVAAEARLRVLCSWSRSTSSLAMGWADPLVRSSSVPRIDGMAAELDDVDDDGAWQTAMCAADAVGAAYLYRVTAPHAWYFLALDALTFAPAASALPATTPVDLVLRSLDETRRAIESRAEPASTLRDRLASVGNALVREASFAYRDTDWVARLERTGKCLLGLASRLPRPTFSAIAAGHHPDEFLSRDATLDLAQSVSLLEDEWGLFA
ncbi:MAG TPA: hypothetical protein VGM56_05210 [Byssovorax sp.]|jgi:hypothetical protein